MEQMDSDRDLQFALGWNRWNMKVVGIWPDPSMPKQRWNDFKALVTLLIIFVFGVGPQSANLFFLWGDVTLVAENLSIANIPGINAMMKLIFAWHYRDVFKPIIQHFFDDWRSPKTKEERDTMTSNAKSGRNISVWGSILTMTMETTYLGVRTITIAQTEKTEENLDHLAIYPGYFPYDIRPIPLLLFTNMFQICAGYLATIAYTTVDTFIAMLVIHICGQFEILRYRLERLMGDGDNERDVITIQKELAEIVKKHDDLNEFAAKIEECFNMLLLIQMLLCTIEICFQGFMFFNVLLKEPQTLLIIMFVLLVIFILVHIYIYCYIGEMLLVQSKKVFNAAYESNWFNVPPPEARCLILIMQRSNRPLCLTAGKFSTFSMEMFSSILRTAMGYMSVLLTVASSD